MKCISMLIDTDGCRESSPPAHVDIERPSQPPSAAAAGQISS